METGNSRKCAVCGSTEKLRKCCKCRLTYYCSRDHQRAHWKVHKKVCSQVVAQPKDSLVERNCGSPNADGKAIIEHRLNNHHIDALNLGHGTKDTEPRPSNGATTETSSSDVRDRPARAGPIKRQQGSSPKQAAVTPQAQGKVKESTRNATKIADCVVKRLQMHGFCFVDSFLGSDTAIEILKEVRALDASGTLRTKVTEHCVKAGLVACHKNVWVEYGDDRYPYIQKLLKQLDSVVTHCQGRLDEYHIDCCSKALVSCYPAGTESPCHVDMDIDYNNGVCITCVYYLNKGWNSSNGGELRIFSESFARKSVDIAPLFDRQLFFWSDRRNPHKVQTACEKSYAITVWYSNTGERAKVMCKQQQLDQIAKVEAK